MRVNQFFPELEGLRGILALWVFMYHAASILGGWTALPPFVQSLLDGGAPVDVFIILSGFVIARLLVAKKEPYAAYIKRRFWRLYPTYAVCILAALALAQAGVMPQRVETATLPWHLMAHMLMLHGAVPNWVLEGSSGAILNPAWSVSLEWQFYLVAPLLIRFPFFGLAVSCLAYRLVLPTLDGFTVAFLLKKLPLFWCGIGSFFALQTGLGRTAAIAGLAVFFFALPVRNNFGLLLWLLLLMQMTAERTTAAQALLSSRPLRLLGAVSYPLYLCHEPIVFATQSAGLTGAVGWSVALAFSLGAAALIHVFVEARFIKSGRAALQDPMLESVRCPPEGRSRS